MVKTAVRWAAPFAAMLCLAGCEIFTVTPFPGFTDRTDIAINLGARIDAIANGQSPINYDLAVADYPSQQPRVLLLVEPPSSDPTEGFKYTGQIILMDQDLKVLGQATTEDTGKYFSRPYSYAADTNSPTGFDILAGYTALNPASGNRVITLTPSGLEGFAFTDGSNTYAFSTPAGQYASFDLQFVEYTNTWGILAPPASGNTVAIIPPAARPSTSDPNYANLGYQLVGLAYDSATTNVTFVLSEPAQGRIVAARMSLSAAVNTSTAGVLLPGATSWPVPASAWPTAVNADRPELHADAGGFFMVQRDGWMTRYTWDTSGGTPTLTGSRQVVGDRSLSRHYAFLIPQTAGLTQYMYRFDPASRTLTRYKRWW
jgi:hypothetical protein